MAAAGVLNLIVKKVSSGTFSETQLSQLASTTLKAGSRISVYALFWCVDVADPLLQSVIVRWC